MAIDGFYAQSMVKQAQADPQRPAYHFAPPAAWMNDPNGFVYFKGQYHLFYQCNPLGPQPGRMGWGHATSPDGLHWQHQPLAMAPKGGFAAEGAKLPEGGCFTGCPVVRDDILYLLYTRATKGEDGEMEQVQCLAWSEDGLHFTQEDEPVIGAFPPEGSEQFRDPKVWRRGDAWYCVIGSCKNGLGNALLYQSKDLREWTYVGEMLRAASAQEHGWMWECPSLFTVDGVDILLFSPMGLEDKGIICAYFTGKLDYETGWFQAKGFHPLCHSPEFYSAQVYTPQGYDAPVLISWMQHWVVPEYPTAQNGWNGVHSLHYSCGYDARSDRLLLTAVPQYQKLRKQILLAGSAQAISSLGGVASDSFELLLKLDIGDAGDNDGFALNLRCSEDQSEYTQLRYQPATGMLTVDCTHSGQQGGNLVSSGEVGRDLSALTLHIFVDRCSIEVMADGGKHLFCHRIFPKEDSRGMQLSCSGAIRVDRLEIYEMEDVWAIS